MSISKLTFDMNSKKIAEIINEKDSMLDFSQLNSPLFFDTAMFHQYHEKFAEKVYELNFYTDNKIKGRCYFGKKNNGIRMPYSSPFSMIYPSTKWNNLDMETISDGIIEIMSLTKSDSINISFPPSFYYPGVIESQIVALLNSGFTVDYIDINHYLSLSEYKCIDEFMTNTSRSFKKQYKYSKDKFVFSKIPNDNFLIAYETIRKNREENGYPLKISETHMREIININNEGVHCYGVFFDQICVASAIIFDINDEISQVVYWGDLLNFRSKYPMNFLIVSIIERFIKEKRIILDIGPSSENGIINIGLSDFKKSAGCKNTIKISLKYK